MDFRGRLFLRRDPYGNKGGDGLFISALREAVKANAAGFERKAEKRQCQYEEQELFHLSVI